VSQEEFHSMGLAICLILKEDRSSIVQAAPDFAGFVLFVSQSQKVNNCLKMAK
jgi:hypothetical protein